MKNKRVISVLGAVIFSILYIATICSYTKRMDISRQHVVNHHASVVADDVWHFDKSSVGKYLKLAIESDHYSNVTVLLANGVEYLSLANEHSTHYGGLEKVLIQYRIAPKKTYRTDIVIKGESIGTMSVVLFTRDIEYYFNAFLLFFVSFLILNFISYLHFSRKRLNQMVLERTIQLREKEEDLRTTMNCIGDAVIATDVSGHITRVNPVACDLICGTEADLLGQSLSDKVVLYQYDSKAKINVNVSALIERRQVDSLSGVVFLAHPDKGKVVRLVASPIFTNTNKCTGLVIVISDISEMKALEHKLIQSQKLESIGLMAGGVAHDLNNILSGVVGYSELLLLDFSEDSDLKDQIAAIHESGERAATVVADLLTVARGAVSIRELQNINTLAQEYLNSPEYQKLKSLHPKIKFKQQLNVSQPNILCSSVHVKKCLMNLVANASEAIPEDGTIVVSTANQTVDIKSAASHHVDAGDYVVLDVCNNGPCIKKEDLEHIFEPFHTKKSMGRSGTGLGLTIVWNTMKDHGGWVSVKSHDKKTCFQLFFPVTKREMLLPEHNVIEDYSGNGEHILVVDDELHLRSICGKMLQKLGYRVDSVSSGELAIQFVKDHKVDLLVLDMLMGAGLTGRQTYEAIKVLYPDQKAVIASGFSKSGDVKASIQLGAGGFIKKPYSIDQLGRAVKEILNN